MPRKREVIELLDSDSEEGGGGGSDYEPTAAAKKAPKRKAAAAPKAKQPRAPKAPKKEAEEKRTGPDGKTVRKLGAPSQKVQDRIARALPGSAHRMFLVSTEEVRPAGAPGGRAHKFAVLGATGNGAGAAQRGGLFAGDDGVRWGEDGRGIGKESALTVQ
ncbi:hypothetical protein MNEG_7997 [Monoraphidium neglectum]|uniref:Uncharacterized protein n=1 Tax=Monoraphidium neglectum TaxID=145388 RepID=A0A0D2N0W7_9CHLO|nr:hypothetical protein MNEG_7997 [Monoraphidium neglectum]KIY99965.1 hypothetical protein MNEG_7997 [Monoraphidium neglectum]|eukprot:XP_013898985.1 hypothetical protein MNEG_7997 [Monoraphidium neglectum]